MATLPILNGGETIIPVQALPRDRRRAELKSRTPTLSEKLSYWLARNWYGDNREGVQKAERLVDVGRSTIIGNVPFAAYDATRAAAEGRPGEAALNAAAVVAPLAALRGTRSLPKGAVIRPDNVFRGRGVPTTGIKDTAKPYAVRVTGLDQLEDMVQSGLVRPNKGGYGKQKKSTLYFAEADSVAGTNLNTKINESKVRIVVDGSVAANRKGPIPIDELKHIFAIRDGKEVDILQEVLRRNREPK